MVEFSDPELPDARRDTVYYVRAIEAPSPAINGDPVACRRRDENGRCLEVAPCYGDRRRTPQDDDCTAAVEERAWSSPIFVDFAS